MTQIKSEIKPNSNRSLAQKKGNAIRKATFFALLELEDFGRKPRLIKHVLEKLEPEWQILSSDDVYNYYKRVVAPKP